MLTRSISVKEPCDDESDMKTARTMYQQWKPMLISRSRVIAMAHLSNRNMSTRGYQSHSLEQKEEKFLSL